MILGSFSLVHFDIFDQSKYRQFFPEERKLTICCFLQDFEDLWFPDENLFLSLLAQDRRIFFVRLLFPGRSPVSHVLQHLSFFIKKNDFFRYFGYRCFVEPAAEILFRKKPSFRKIANNLTFFSIRVFPKKRFTQREQFLNKTFRHYLPTSK